MALRPIESISGLFDTDEGKLVGIFPTGTNDVSYLPTSEKRVSGNPVAAVVDPVTGGITKIWTGTQAQYDAIATKADDTLYIIASA